MLVTISLLAACSGTAGGDKGLEAPHDDRSGASIADRGERSSVVGARSGDSAIAPTAGELDVFYVSPKRTNVMRRYFDIQNGWRTEPIARSALSASTPFASVSRTPDTLDVFWADESANVVTASWNRTSGAWESRPALPASSSSHVPPHAPVAAVSRRPSRIDVFYIGTDGALRSVAYDEGAAFASGAVSAPHVATPGTGVAVVAPTPNDLDVFFIGLGGKLWQSTFHEGNGWSAAAPLPNQAANVAPSIAGVTATARTATSLDAFFVGTDGAVHWSSLQNGTWQNDGTLAGDWTSGKVSPPGMPGVPGENLSAAVVPAESPEIDVAYTGRDLSTYVARGPMTPGFPWTAWPTALVTSAYDVLADPNGRISLTARTTTNRDLFVEGGSQLYTSASRADSGWTMRKLTVAKPAQASLAAAWDDAGATSLSMARASGASFEEGALRFTTKGWDATSQWVSGDFDGDGLTDAARIWNDRGANAITVRESSGSALAIAAWPGAFGAWFRTTIWLAGDFDGDGIDDLAAVWNDDGATSLAVCGKLTGCARWATIAAWDPASQWMAGDFNGDGKTDIAAAWNDDGTNALAVHRSTGASFVPSTWLTKGGAWQASTKWLAGDFTGDGKADVAAARNDAGSTEVDVFGSLGNAFAGGVKWGANADWDPTSKWVTFDWSGDGKADIATISNDGGANVIAMRQSTGSAFTLDPGRANGGTFRSTTQWLGGRFE